MKSKTNNSSLHQCVNDAVALEKLLQQPRTPNVTDDTGIDSAAPRGCEWTCDTVAATARGRCRERCSKLTWAGACAFGSCSWAILTWSAFWLKLGPTRIRQARRRGTHHFTSQPLQWPPRSHPLSCRGWGHPRSAMYGNRANSIASWS